MIPTEELLTRGVQQVLPMDLAKAKLASGKPLRLYLGIDPTGSKLHLGHSVPLRKLKQFADAGHHVIFLVGSFTAMIGDPSGRDTQRESLTKESVEENFRTYKEQAKKILDFDKDVEVVYNHTWLEKLGFREIVKLASTFTVQQMLERDMFQRRLEAEKPIHLHEFLYPVMVGYDSVFLDVDFEVGGSDQEFNMLAGRTLQEACGKRPKFVLTMRLIEGTDGRKMSKTYENCVYLEDAPGEMYGKLMSISDALIPVYMECCTDMPMEEVRKAESGIRNTSVQLSTGQESGINPKDLKMRLAREIVTMYHSAEAAKSAEEEFQNIFRDKGRPEDIPAATAQKGNLIIEVMVANGLAKSKSEAKRLIAQDGVKVNDRIIHDEGATAEEGILQVGKRKFLKVTF